MRLYVFLLSWLHTVMSYRPVVLVHGIMSEASHLLDLRRLIETHHPGTEVIPVKLYPEVESFVPLNRQLAYWEAKILPIMKKHPQGIHLICHSQGGLVCQGLVEKSHNVHTFVALSSPINGEFGVPQRILDYLPWLTGTRESLSKYLYTSFAQHSTAFSNYWKDPRTEYRNEYAEYARFLPLVQNDPLQPTLNKTDAAIRKKNLLEIKTLVLIGGPGDDVIKPWQSSLFGFYGNDMEIVPMEKQQFYVDDWFGLRTLDERGDLHKFVFPNVSHVHWHGDETVFNQAIQQFLD